MNLVYLPKLVLHVQKTDVSAQKIDNSLQETYSMAIHNFKFVNELFSLQVHKNPFLLTDISMEIVLSLPFLNFNNADISITL